MSKLKELREIKEDCGIALQDHQELCLELPSECRWCGALQYQYDTANYAFKETQEDYEPRLSSARAAVVEASRSCKAQLPTQVAYAVDALELIEAEESGGEVG